MDAKDVVERLRAQRRAAEAAIAQASAEREAVSVAAREAGPRAGRRWAETVATYEQLKDVARHLERQERSPAGTGSVPPARPLRETLPPLRGLAKASDAPDEFEAWFAHAAAAVWEQVRGEVETDTPADGLTVTGPSD